jgi:hypothetical protein
MIIDRDINGCKNILKMLMVSLNQIDKPEAFKRTNKSLPSLICKRESKDLVSVSNSTNFVEIKCQFLKPAF